MMDNLNMPNIKAEPTRKELLPKKSLRKSTLIITLVLIFSVGLFIGRYVVPAGELKYSPLQFVSVEEGERQLTFPAFWETWDILHSKYINDIDDQELFYGSVAGMVRAVGDPYTVYSPPEDTKQFEETIKGVFSGIGVEIGMRKGLITVIAPLEGSPAQQAGVLQGDVIIGVNQETITQDTTIDEVVQKIRGPKGEAVIITIARSGDNEPKDISIIRDTIEIESVRVKNENGITHISITNFNGDTSERFTKAAKQAVKAKTKGIIIDVRNNPGGYLDSAVDIASVILDRGTLVVSEKGTQDKEYNASGKNILKDIPIVILVNSGSASASEILAGALSDQLNTPIIGTKTFGKGSVQEFIKLEDNSSLRVTVAKWFTPNGRSISDEGIEPTIEVEEDYETEEDEQLNKAREELQKLIEE
jgi:carboxyl-terminal processing protease